MKKEIREIIKILSKAKKTLSLRLIIIIGAILLLLVGIYLVYAQTKVYQVKQAEKEKQAQELAKSQQEALEKTKQELESLKERQTEQESKPPQIITKEIIKEVPVNIDEITTAELNTYLPAVVLIVCEDASGSGFLWKFENNNYSVITNKHVVEKEYNAGTSCWGTASNLQGDGISAFLIFPNLHSLLNPTADILSSRLQDNSYDKVETLNYKLTTMRKCPNDMPVGSPVVIVGFPAFGRTKTIYNNYDYERISTEGKISGYLDIDLITRDYISISNYYVSATIDSGNSGGIAISKDKSGLCLLGVPTWLTLGNYATQGIVQNINNIFK